MIDFLELRIPFFAELLSENASFDGRWVLNLKSVAAADGIRLQAGSVLFDESDDSTEYVLDELRHPYESLKSSFSGLAFKIFPFGFGKYETPHILLKGSPAKIMQGHNVYGSCKFKPAFLEFAAILGSVYPSLYSRLDLKQAEIRAIDCTFFARVDSPFMAKQIIKMLTSVSNRHIRSSREKYETTAYQNRASTYYSLKTYLKEFEVKNEIKELTKTYKSSLDTTAKENIKTKLEILNEAYAFSKNMIRFEGRMFARKMEKHAIPVNAFEFAKYVDGKDEEIIKKMWLQMFSPLFETFKGQTMDTLDDESIINNIKIKFDSKRKQTKLIQFFLLIKSLGYEKAKDISERTTFWRNEKDLLTIGLSKINLQNIRADGFNVLPFVKIVNIEFTNQVPDKFKEPRSQFEPTLELVG